MKAVEVRDLNLAFGGVKAVSGVSFGIDTAEIVGIIGPNGSGKSTLFNLLTGVYAPASGTIALLGRDITGWAPYRIARAGLGRTFQIPAPFTNMTVYENLLTAAVEGAWNTAHERAERIVDALGLGAVVHDPAETLSGGQLRLLEFGRVWMRDPAVFLLDEVTAGVNPRLRQIILDAVRGLRDAGKTFLVIEHDMELLQAIAERVIVMDAGLLVMQGSFAEVASNQQVIDAYLGRPDS